MTAEAQRAAIRKMIAEHTKNVTSSKKKALKSLVKEGFCTSDGQLTEQYGGKKQSAAS
jgi:hypothetical protein